MQANDMVSYEADAYREGYRAAAGIDEVGRGPLAGPVVAAAVIFNNANLPAGAGIKDSKKLSPKRRKELLPVIYRAARAVSVGIVWNDAVDELNIHAATLAAMQKAVESLSVAPDILLIDGRFPIKTLKSQTRQKTIVSGDSISLSIAAASIVAKTVRDNIMDAYHRLFPLYNFVSNKGYGTEEHLDALRRMGPCPIHRRSFNGVVRP